MSDDTARLHLPQLVSLQELNAVTWNEALEQIDALVDLCLVGVFVNDPPLSPQEGDAYLTGGTPTGAWAGYAYKIASCRDGAWRFYQPFNGLRAFVRSSGAMIVYNNGAWIDTSSSISANEVALASADACDLAGANALFVQITGTTAIRSFGTGANKLRTVRFAGALTLTHSATSLALLGGASRTTAAGDSGVYASDASGNWRELSYVRAAKDPGDYATRSGSETLSGKTLSVPTVSGGTINDAAIGGTTPAAGRFTILGVNATADATNKFALASTAVLFDNIGNGTQLKINKRAGGDTASVLYQTNYSGRAEIGLCGDDNFHFKVSPDGSSWTDALMLDKTAGSVGIGASPSAFRLQVAGSIGPNAANSYSLGSASLYWANGYIQNAWTVVCDETLKDEIAGLSDAEMAVAKEIAPLVSLYKMKSAIAEKGSARARKHCGWIAQRIEQVFIAHGLDPFAYGCVGCDTVRADDCAPKTVHNLRVAEVTAFALAGLAARVTALEAKSSHAR